MSSCRLHLGEVTTWILWGGISALHFVAYTGMRELLCCHTDTLGRDFSLAFRCICRHERTSWLSHRHFGGGGGEGGGGILALHFVAYTGVRRHLCCHLDT